MLNNAYEKKSSAAKENHNGNGHSEEPPKSNGSRALPLKGALKPLESEKVDIFRLLDQLEELPDLAKHLPLKLMYGFDHEKFYYLVLKIRANLPEDLKKAQKVAMETERIVDEAKDAAEQQKETGRIHANRILEDARREADQILEAARQESARLVSSSEVVRLASTQAREVLNNVETEASEIRKGADDYAADVLANLEQAVDKTLTGVKKNKAIFQSMKK